MKTKLLSLLTLLLVSIGAWADVDFGTQKTVNTTTTWNFESLSGQVGQSAYTAITTFDGVKYYLRAGASNTCEIKDGGSANSQTFADGTVVDARYYVSFNTKWSANPSAMAYAGTDGVKALSALAFNIESAGTCYVKIKGTASDQFRIYYTNPDITDTYTSAQYTSFATGGIDEIAYTAPGPGAIMITDNTSAFEIYAVRFVPKSEEPKVSQTTTWTFNGLEAGTYKLNKPIAGNSGDKGYMHASIRTNSSMTVAENSSNDKFGDDTAVSWTKVVTSAGKMQGFTETTISAAFESVTGHYFSPGFAFNTSVPGTCYALISSAASKKVRIYHSDGSSITNVSTIPTGTEICKLSSGVKAVGTFYVGGVDDAFTIYAVRFVPATYTLKINAENGTVSCSPEKTKYNYNDVVTLTATPADGYKFVSWSGVDSSEGATATVTMTADKDVTANFTKEAVVVKWNFEQYMNNVNMFGSSSSQDVIEFTDGLYLHTRDADSDNHKVLAAKATIASDLTENISSQTKTYYRESSYTGLSFKATDPTQRSEIINGTKASANISVNGISYQAPATGTFFYTIYTEASNAHVYSTKNGTETDNSIGKGSKTGIGREFSISVEKDDVVYITTSANPIYLLEAMFVPSSLDATKTTVTFKAVGEGYATFSSTKNYIVPEGITAYYATSNGSSGQRVNLSPINSGSVIPACTGVILYKDGVSAEDVDVKMTTTSATAALSTNYLLANIKDYVLPADDGTNYNYTLAAGPTFMHSSGSGTLAAGKAFLRTTENVTGPNAKLALIFDGETTGINAIENSELRIENSDAPMYNLAGQRVSKSYKGVVIQNGKKFMNK